jgi:predicted urease superfamily metal-dependent hydrolase
MHVVFHARKRAECIGVLSGLHLSREVATHFAQKTFFQAAVALCDKLKLPIVLHLAGDEQSFDAVVELLREAGWLPQGVTRAHARTHARTHARVRLTAGHVLMSLASVQGLGLVQVHM